MSIHPLPRAPNSQPDQVEAPGYHLAIDPVTPPPILPAFTAMQAEAVHAGEKTREQAEEMVREHTGANFDAAAAKASERPIGERERKKKQLIDAEDDLRELDRSIGASVKGDEIDQHVPEPKKLTDFVELGIVSAAALALTGASVYVNHSFLEGSAIYSGPAALVGAAIPMVGAFYAKDPLSSLTNDAARRNLRLTYTALAAGAVLVWIATFGHEAGAPLASLNDLNSTAAPTQSNTTAYTIRALAQVIAEMCGGAVLFHRAFEIARNEGAGKTIKKVYQTRDKYRQESEERKKARELCETLQHHLESIEEWFRALPFQRAAYVSKAVTQFEHNLTTLQG